MISLEAKLKCLGRELALRRAAYPRWVAAGRMKQEVADFEIVVMEAIINDYAEQRAQSDDD